MTKGLDLQALEGAHVVLLFAVELVADGQMRQGVAAQIQAEEMAGGILLVGGRGIVAGGGVKVPVSGEDLEIIEACKLRERIVDLLAHSESQSGVHFRDQGMSALALEGFEVGFDLDVDLMTVAEILQKLAPALTGRETAPGTDLQPARICNRCALTPVATARQLLS